MGSRCIKIAYFVGLGRSFYERARSVEASMSKIARKMEELVSLSLIHI